MGEKLYKKINEYSPTAYVCHKIICNDQDEYRDFEFIEMNKAFEKIIGLDAKLVLGRKISDLHRKNLKNKLFWIDFYTELSKSIKNQEFKCYFDFLDKHFRINTHYVERNSFIIYFTDIINEIKQNEKINILSDNIETQIFYLLDAETYGPVNKAHVEFLGFSKEDFRCKNIDNFYDEKQVKICIKGNEKVFKEKKQIITEEWIVNAKNKRRLLKVVKTPKFDPKGEVEFVTCTAEDITEKKSLEIQEQRKEKILFSMVDFTKELLTNDDPYMALSNGIEMIGKATEVDRVYYWENHQDLKTGRWLTSQKVEWCLHGIVEQINNPELQNVLFEDAGDFLENLVQNKPFISHIRNMENSLTKKTLEAQEILSILVIPVFIKGIFKGFIGFDSCTHEREWSKVEISLLSSFGLLYEKAVEKKLLESSVIQIKENFSNFFNMSDDLFFVLDLKGSIIQVNKTASSRLNYTEEELLGKSISQFHPIEMRGKTNKTIVDMLDGSIDNCNIPFITKDGKSIPVETHLTKGIWNGLSVIFVVSKDISKLKMSEEKFSKAFNNSGVSMFINTAEEGIFLDVNNIFLRTIGFRRDEIIGKNIFDNQILIGLKDKINIANSFKKANKTTNMEISFKSKDNSIMTGLINITPLYINNELCLLSSMIDITNQKLMVEELAKAKESSDMGNRAKSDFLSHISHEIRTPMNAVIGYSDLLLFTNLNSSQEKYLKGIRSSSQMLLGIINDILDWTKIDNNKIKLEKRAFNIRESIENVVNQMQYMNISNKVITSVKVASDVPEILVGDSLRLQQVLLNLLGNAVKFTSQGEIHIEVKKVESIKNRLKLEFSVRDTGRGIAKDEIKDIFNPFKQVIHEDNHSHPGTGLGLPISKEIIKSMEGEIWVKSQVNKGSIFTFTSIFNGVHRDKNIYREKQDFDHLKETLNISKRLSGIKVLAVDDNEINQDVIREMLKAQGIIVDLASSGFEAIKLVQEKNYDLILMDIRMPKMNGCQTTKRIREIERLKDLPIIAVSANASEEEIQRCLKFGLNDYIIKPVKKNDLFKAIAKQLDKEDGKAISNSWIGEEKLNSNDNLPIVDGIDIDKLLQRFNQDKEFIVRILNKFKKNYKNVVEEIRNAMLLGDLDISYNLVHSLRGVAGEILVDRVYRISKEIEFKIRDGDLDIEALLLELEDNLKRIFSSPIFIEDEPEKNHLLTYKKLDKKGLKALLDYLDILLLESDINAGDYIFKIKNHTKNTSVYKEVLDLDGYIEKYDFQGALKVSKNIRKILS